MVSNGTMKHGRQEKARWMPTITTPLSGLQALPIMFICTIFVAVFFVLTCTMGGIVRWVLIWQVYDLCLCELYM